MSTFEVSCVEEVIELAKYERLGMRSIEAYHVLSRNGRIEQMMYPIDTLQGAVELWMGEFPNCQGFNIDLANILLDKDILGLYDVPCGVWDSTPRHPLVWRLMWSHYVCELLGLLDPCNIESDDVRIVPKEIAEAVQEFFDDEPKPPFWDPIPDIIDI